ncbi:transposase [Salinibacter ruber]|uniref:Transposase n=1 Tax=Salinibacter ruber TaxID=146919 RepID=A0A9X2TK81_9BACT|nr:transposase [Salinibacter ruber]
MDLTSGTTHVRAYEKGRSDCTIQYLESVLKKTTGRVLLIWDQAKWHTSKKVRKWLDSHGRIETHLLPAWSPETNPMEDLWRELFRRVAACLERSLDTLLKSTKQYLANLSGKQALRTAGLYSN